MAVEQATQATSDSAVELAATDPVSDDETTPTQSSERSIRLAAENPGDIADTEDRTIASITIGDGEIIMTNDGDSSFWISSAEIDNSDTWSSLATAFPETGLWPLQLEFLSIGAEEGRPWRSAELYPESVSTEDVANILSRWSLHGPVDQLAPATEGPDTHPLSPSEFGAESANLGMVPVSRPADVVAHLGWWGPANYGQTPGEMSAVLRSWEDRYGAYVTRLGFAEMSISVTRPPTDSWTAQALAVEHYAWCPGLAEFGVPIEAYAIELQGATEWFCWWD